MKKNIRLLRSSESGESLFTSSGLWAPANLNNTASNPAASVVNNTASVEPTVWVRVPVEKSDGPNHRK